MKKILSSLIILFMAAAGDALGCTTAVISARASATGRPMLFKQRDSSVKFNYVDFFPATDSTFAFTGVVNTRDEERESVWSGANTEGFAIMNAMSYGLSPLVTDNRPWEGIIMKRALEICRTVDDFEEYIKSLPQPNGLESNFGVIDAAGGAAYFEVHDFGYTRFNVEDSVRGYLVRSNYSMTGREGEGHGYDRFVIATSKMVSHEGGFTPEWLIDAIGRDPAIARKTTVSCTVIEGVTAGDPLNSSVIWCAPGYTPAAYAIPAWVAAGDAIASPLKSGEGCGSELNEMSWILLQRHFLPNIKEDLDGSIRCHYDKGRCRKVMFMVSAAESAGFTRARALDSRAREGSASPEDFAAFNKETALAWEDFARSMEEFL